MCYAKNNLIKKNYLGNLYVHENLQRNAFYTEKKKKIKCIIKIRL